MNITQNIIELFKSLFTSNDTNDTNDTTDNLIDNPINENPIDENPIDENPIESKLTLIDPNLLLKSNLYELINNGGQSYIYLCINKYNNESYIKKIYDFSNKNVLLNNIYIELNITEDIINKYFE